MTFSPFSAPRRKSSSPNAIAVWTMPVPSSALTKSPSSTLWPLSPYASAGMNGDGGVRHERPRLRRPHEQPVAGAERARRPGDREAHEDRRVLDVAVAL